MQEYDGYVVQYSAIHSIDLSPQIARQYGVSRDPNHGLLMINVQKKNSSPTAKAVAAKITGVARNITGQTQTLALHEVREGAIVYYLAEVAVENLDLMTFDLKITPDGSNQVLALRFQQRFYVED